MVVIRPQEKGESERQRGREVERERKEEIEGRAIDRHTHTHRTTPDGQRERDLSQLCIFLACQVNSMTSRSDL